MIFNQSFSEISKYNNYLNIGIYIYLRHNGQDNFFRKQKAKSLFLNNPGNRIIMKSSQHELKALHPLKFIIKLLRFSSFYGVKLTYFKITLLKI